MRRLIPVLIAILVASALPVYARNCCDSNAVKECHHSKPAKGNVPCGPALSVCPDSACLMDQGAAVVTSMQSYRLVRQPLTPPHVSLALPTPRISDPPPGERIRPCLHQTDALFLRNHAFLI
jgi:hypothetical protein